MAEPTPQSQELKREREIVLSELEAKDQKVKSVPAASQHKRITTQKAPPQAKKVMVPEKPPVQKIEKRIKKFTTNREDHFWIKTIPFFVAICILAVVVVINLGLYYSPSLTPIAKPLARFFHYPVAFVGTSIITFPHLETEQKLVRQFYVGDQQLNGGTIPSDQTVSNVAYNKLIRDTVLKPEYKKRNISISADELEAGFVYMFGTPSSDQNATQIIRLFNQTPEQFKQTYLMDFLLQAKLAAQLQQDSERVRKKVEQIQQLHATVLSHPDQFGSIAKQVNNDSTAPVSGDLGFLSSLKIPQAFSAIQTLPVNSISDIIETTDAYYFFQVIERIPGSGSDQNSSVVHARQIVVHKDTATSFADELLAQHHVVLLNPSYVWSSGCSEALPVKGGSCSVKFQANQFSFSAVVSALTNTVPAINSHFSPNAP